MFVPGRCLSRSHRVWSAGLRSAALRRSASRVQSPSRYVLVDPRFITLKTPRPEPAGKFWWKRVLVHFLGLQLLCIGTVRVHMRPASPSQQQVRVTACSSSAIVSRNGMGRRSRLRAPRVGMRIVDTLAALRVACAVCRSPLPRAAICVRSSKAHAASRPSLARERWLAAAITPARRLVLLAYIHDDGAQARGLWSVDATCERALAMALPSSAPRS